MAETETLVSDQEAREHDGLISHLKFAVVPGAVEAAEAKELDEAVEEISDAKLPKTIGATIAAIREAMSVHPQNKMEVKVNDAWLVRLRAHLQAISQGPTCGPITTTAHGDIARTSSDHAEDIHMSALCRADSIVAKRLADDAAAIESLTAGAANDAATIAELTAKLKKQSK